jgi:hypothetical protein
MTIRTSGGKLLTKDGKLSCDCCGGGEWYCHVGVCFNAFVGGIKYKVNGTAAPFVGDTYTWKETHTHSTLGTLTINGFAQKVPVLDPCKFYLKISIEVIASVGGYKTFYWSPAFNANDYAIGGPVSDSISESTVSARPQENGSSVTGTHENPLWAAKWASYGTPTFSVEMTFNEIADARCVTP